MTFAETAIAAEAEAAESEFSGFSPPLGHRTTPYLLVEKKVLLLKWIPKRSTLAR